MWVAYQLDVAGLGQQKQLRGRDGRRGDSEKAAVKVECE